VIARRPGAAYDAQEQGDPMTDVYATIATVDPAVQERLAVILEMRAANPQQRAMLESYLSELEFPPGARVLEIGCGTGAVTRVLASRRDVAEAIGVDPSPIFVAKARELSAGLTSLSFEEGDGRALRFRDVAFDVVVFHTTLCHVPEPERALAEAYRVLRPGGWLAIFDGDYTTTTVALGDFDPLQNCVETVLATLVNDCWIVRRLPSLVRSAGFDGGRLRSYGYAETAEPAYMLTIVDRGADTLASWGRIGAELCASLKAEARRRAEAGMFFGFIGFASLIARKPMAG
jgi:ubiquinone/menaquinone biosynthesis C-methylase UbiE